MKRVLLIVYSLAIFLFPYLVFAKTPNVTIENIELIDKSNNTVILNDASANQLDINFDIEFNNLNDYAKYKIIVKNSDDDNYILKNNFDDQSSYITYELEMDNDYLEKNSTKEIMITIKYNSTCSGDTVLNETQSLTILTEDNEVIPVESNSITEVINNIVDTFKGKNAPINIIGLLLIIGGCFLIFKHANILAIILFLLPTYSYAQEELSININSKITIHGESVVNITMFDTGREVNNKMKKLAGDTDITVATTNTTITAIKKSDTAPNLSEMGEDNIVSISSEKPIYMWFDSGIIYWYSPDEIVYYNSNSSYFYSLLTKVDTIEDLEDINTSKVTNMSYMFDYTGMNAESFHIGNINNWNTSNVKNMSGMFSWTGCNTTTWSIGDLSSWNTSNVTNMARMFYGAAQNASECNVGNLDNWDTLNVTSMISMFSEMGHYSTSWNIGNLGGWNTSNVTNFSEMFLSAGARTETWSIGNLDNWNTSKATNMSGMFQSSGYSSTNWNIGNLSEWDTSNVTNFSKMFATTGYSSTTWEIGDIGNWNTSKATNMSAMFSFAAQKIPNFDLDLSNWDTSKVTDMNKMFNATGQYSNTWILRGASSWDTSKVTDMNEMFSYAGNRSTSFQLDISNWNTSSVTNMADMFNIAGHQSSTWNVIIPRTNGNEISNTTTKIYGSTEDVYYSLSGREFTFATN